MMDLNPTLEGLPPLEALAEIPSPALLIDRGRVEANIALMVDIAGADRLRPHLKTHKMREVVQLQMAAGINKFKAATPAELEMAASEGAAEVLLAMQPVGPNIDRLARAIERFPDCAFSALVDNPQSADQLSGLNARLFIDIDVGMHRSGIAFGAPLDSLIDHIGSERLAGLHVYDGHLHAPSLEERSAAVREIIDRVRAFELPLIGGGSPTFAIWARETEYQCSPGTTLLWDAGYGRAYPDLPFDIAALLLSRVVSKPGANRLCLDLGHKAVAAENPLERRVFFPALADMRPVSQSEEHLVIETAAAAEFSVGDPLYAIPQHICPTVALHARAHLVSKGAVTGETWQVVARDR